ncbi:MAG: hypothetical protein KGK33_01235 [Hyphomicrobiales bacterium]|nr:hypothetical protein [Hyphomicrobiales bacterium]
MTDRPTRLEKEIEITPEMIEAASAVFGAWLSAGDYDAPPIPPAVLRAMFLAMEQARRETLSRQNFEGPKSFPKSQT